jgi:potassium-dependent mechanosensitive channel
MVFSRCMIRIFRHTAFWLILVGMAGSLLFPITATAETAETIPLNNPASIEVVKTLLENALAAERSDPEGLEQGLKRWKRLKTAVQDELAAYRIQNTAHSNLLLVLKTRIEDLENALNANRLAIKNLSDRIAEFEKIGSIASERTSQLADRISIAENQLAELHWGTLASTDKAELRKKLDKLLGFLRDKKKLGEQFLKEHALLLEQLKRGLADLKETRKQIEERLQLQVKTNLYERTLQPFERLRIQRLQAELLSIKNRSNALLKADFWRRQWTLFKHSGGGTQTVFLVLFLSAVIFRRKVRRYFYSVESKLEGPVWRMRRLALSLLRQSFVLVCTAVLLGLYDLLKLPHVNFSLGRFLNQLVFTLLLVRWAMDFCQSRIGDFDSQLSAFVQGRMLNFLRLLRGLVIFYFVLVGLFGTSSDLAWAVRLALEIALLVRVASFWRRLQIVIALAARKGESPPANSRLAMIRGWTYFVAVGALLLELTGYDALAVHFLAGWAKTAMLAMWANIGWLSIGEWVAFQKAGTDTEPASTGPGVSAPIGWFLVQMTRLAWFLALLSGGVLVWSSANFMTTAAKQVFSLSFSVGSLVISVKGILLALIIFCLTHSSVKIGKRVLNEKVLDARNFEHGLKESIVTITSYIIWGLGVLLALGVLGVNATSLAVVFGALSIGIGFGLQNIFNNFISGLILLFERPIQVGDYVEVNGMWAEVRKINVRSTIVQTFDNATVIIPNSDFISQQVTNWSFKDPRMRRHVDVGVAYGSDIHLVRNTLLDIAAGIPQILKYPRPDVLFMDHGDSALIFRLRFWVHVNNYYSSSTDVRFELDSRFRELGIEIAFPQRDIHIRSAHNDLPSDASQTVMKKE